MQNYEINILITELCTHVRQEFYDVLSIVQLIRWFLLQEGKSGMKQKNNVMSCSAVYIRKKKEVSFLRLQIFKLLTYKFEVIHTKWAHIQGGPSLSQHRCWVFWRCPQAPSTAWNSLRSFNILFAQS